MIQKTKKHLKRVTKILIKVVLSLIVFVLLYIAVAFVLSGISVSHEEDAKDNVDIYILTNGVHTDIVVPTITTHKNWFKQMDHLPLQIDTAKQNYLAIGWGDKGFYLNTPTWAELKASTAIKAMFGISGTAIHATYYPEMKESSTCKRISVSHNQYLRILQFIDRSLEKDINGNIIKIDTEANKGHHDAFYEATGRYSIFYTCNSWANHVLKDSGQKACLWTAFQKPIFQKYE